jgi:L-ascorbate metabolism protein UlaG (beta-lactamase superfamily)
MKVTYFGYSGFMVETQQAYYLFDYIRGQIPPLAKDKPFYVFVSHSHTGHFSWEIFNPERMPAAQRYIVSRDVNKKLKKSMISENMPVCEARPGICIDLPGCRILPLRSTDVGVAFLVEEEDGATIYHAGDLNWWYGDEKTAFWNQNIEVNYKREIDRLKGKKIDVAFLPLDPKMGEAYWYGMEYFLRTVSPKAVFPMRFWKDYSVISRYIREHGDEQRIFILDREEQEYEI